MTTLGSVVFWTVPPGDYATATVQQLFDELGLEPALKPRTEAAANAFRRLRTTYDKTRYTVPDRSQQRACVVHCHDRGRLSRAGTPDAQGEMRTFYLERHLLTPGGQVAGVHEVGWAKFYYPDPRKKTGATYMNLVLRYDDLVPGEKDHLEALKVSMEATFDAYCRQMDPAKLRALMRAYMHVLDGVQLGESMFFVPAVQAEHLDRVRQLMTALGCPMRRMEVTAELESLQVVAAGATEDLGRQLRWVSDEVGRLYARRTRGVTKTSYLYVRERYDRVMRTARLYTELLGQALSEVGDAAEDALMELERMRGDLR